MNEVLSGVSFMVKSGEIFKLRDDFTKFICDYVQANPEDSRFWYDGHVYFLDNLGNLKSRYELGVEIIPGGLNKLVECMKVIVVHTLNIQVQALFWRSVMRVFWKI